MRWGCQPSLLAPRAGSSPESKVTANIMEGLLLGATLCDQPPSRWEMESQRSAHCKAQNQEAACASAFHSGAAVTTRGHQLRPGGRQREDRVEGTQGQEASILMCLLCEISQLCTELDGAQGWGWEVHGLVSTRRGAVQGHNSGIH